jgi:PAS domain S-box-containing protein
VKSLLVSLLNWIARPGVSRRWSLVLVVLLVGAIGTMVWQARSLSRQIDTVREARSDNLVWLVVQLEVEFLKFRMALVEAQAGDLAEWMAAAARAFDIYYSRAIAFDPAALGIERATDGRAIGVLEAIRSHTIGLAEAFDSTGPEGLEPLRLAALKTSDTLAPLIRDFALLSLDNFIQLAATDRERQQVVLGRFAALSVLLVILLSGLLYLIVDLYRGLAERASAMRRIGSNLTRTIEASRDAIVVTDGDGRIRSFNAAAETTFRLIRDDALGRDAATTLLAPQTVPTGKRPLAPFLPEGESSWRGVVTGQRADGRSFPIEVQAVVDHDSEAQPICFLFLRDISEQREVEAALRIARDSAERHAEARTHFLAVMSHEMRTPLNGVIAALDLMALGPLSKDQRRLLSLGLASGQNALRQVDDLLDFVRREDADGESEPSEVFDPVAVAEALISQHQTVAQRSGNSLRLVVEGQPGRTVSGPRRSYERALGNLLSNAIKFSRDDEIVVHIVREPAADGGATVCVSVTDHGVGIAPQDQARIFDDFERAQPDTTEGTGLGLGIVRRAVRSMGGTLELDSAPNRGSVFRFRVRFAPPPALAVAASSGPPAAPQPVPRAQQALDLLVAEDNPINRALLEEMLFRLGHRVVAVSDGEHAARIAEHRYFDALVFDAGLPGIPGKDALARIRSGGGQSAAAPALCITAAAGPERLRELRTAGFEEALSKPVRLDDLSQALGRITAPPNDRLIDTSVTRDSRDILGEQGFVRLVHRFASETRQALESLDLDGDAEHWARILHQLAGTSAIVGAERLGRLLLAAEACAQAGRNPTPAELRAFLDTLTLSTTVLAATAGDGQSHAHAAAR